MSTTSVMPQPTRLRSSAPSQTKRPTIADITGKGSGLPNRYVLHAVEKFGKTSTLAYAPKPIFIQSRGETGLDALIDTGVVAETPHFPESQTWAEVLGQVDFLIEEEHDFRTLVVDTINGLERLCHEFVCHRDYSDEWGDKGFGSYQKGGEVAATDWRGFLGKLDTLRSKRKMTIFLLCHTKVQNFKNPEGPDYDRYQPDLHKATWSVTGKWCDVILFGNFETTVATARAGDLTKKGKGTGGQQRVIYTERTAAYDAGNRLFKLPAEIEMGLDAKQGWTALYSAIKEARVKKAAPAEPATEGATN
jgi:hypothetical protein